MLAINLVLFTFTNNKQVKSIHFQINNIVALSYLLKMGGIYNQEMVRLVKEIWQFLLQRQITITAEYIPSHLNVIADLSQGTIQI